MTNGLITFTWQGKIGKPFNISDRDLIISHLYKYGGRTFQMSCIASLIKYPLSKKVKIQYKITFEDNIHQITFFAGYLTAIFLGIGFLVSEETEIFGILQKRAAKVLRYSFELQAQMTVQKTGKAKMNNRQVRKKIQKKRKQKASSRRPTKQLPKMSVV